MLCFAVLSWQAKSFKGISIFVSYAVFIISTCIGLKHKTAFEIILSLFVIEVNHSDMIWVQPVVLVNSRGKQTKFDNWTDRNIPKDSCYIAAY